MATGSMEAYKDLTPIAEMVGISRTTLQSRLRVGIQFIDPMFIGYGELHKSGRGGLRKNNKGF